VHGDGGDEWVVIQQPLRAGLRLALALVAVPTLVLRRDTERVAVPGALASAEARVSPIECRTLAWRRVSGTESKTPRTVAISPGMESSGSRRADGAAMAVGEGERRSGHHETPSSACRGKIAIDRHPVLDLKEAADSPGTAGWSRDALANNAHEYFLNLHCTDGVRLRLKRLVNFGPPGQVTNICDGPAIEDGCRAGHAGSNERSVSEWRSGDLRLRRRGSVPV